LSHKQLTQMQGFLCDSRI